MFICWVLQWENTVKGGLDLTGSWSLICRLLDILAGLYGSRMCWTFFLKMYFQVVICNIKLLFLILCPRMWKFVLMMLNVKSIQKSTFCYLTVAFGTLQWCRNFFDRGWKTCYEWKYCNIRSVYCNNVKKNCVFLSGNKEFFLVKKDVINIEKLKMRNLQLQV